VIGHDCLLNDLRLSEFYAFDEGSKVYYLI